MPKMIPSRPSENTKSNAEKRLFKRLMAMEDTDDWTVMHSLAIAEHETQSQGEADFVVVIPKIGVLVLEVKGGGISQIDGQWYSRDFNQIDNPIKNPIEEASLGMYSIKKYIKENSSSFELDRTLFGFGVVFPDTSIHGITRFSEIADEQIADYDDCLTSKSLKAYLLRLANYSKNHCVYKCVFPTVSQCNDIVTLLRPSFEGRVSLHSLIQTIENQVVELTENQQNTFETIVENERCIIRGGAGTGKTILALHFAKQKPESERIGFFCYNKQLASHLKKNTESYKGILCDSFTEYMDSVVIQAGLKPDLHSDPEETSKYYNEILPQLFMEAFMFLDLPLFDDLIIDEAQDLISEKYLEALDFILKGRFKDGKWYFFMDAEKQNLFRNVTNEKDVFELLEKYGAHYTKCMLRDNCRNSVAIIEKIDSVFGTETRHKNNDERGADVTVKTYRKPNDQVEIIETILRSLNREGVTNDQIVILSPHRYQNSACNLITETPISRDPENRKNSVFFSTIQAFKGLESSVVILADIDELSDKKKRDILYVGMTRAKSALYILVQEKDANQLR